MSVFPIAATDKFCIALCGLPGRGKTQIARRIARYLSFFNAIPVEVFTVTEFRRRMYGAVKAADWFDPSNLEAATSREACTTAAIDATIKFLNDHPNGVAVLDSTNPTHERRAKLAAEVFTNLFTALHLTKIIFTFHRLLQ